MFSPTVYRPFSPTVIDSLPSLPVIDHQVISRRGPSASCSLWRKGGERERGEGRGRRGGRICKGKSSVMIQTRQSFFCTAYGLANILTRHCPVVLFFNLVPNSFFVPGGTKNEEVRQTRVGLLLSDIQTWKRTPGWTRVRQFQTSVFGFCAIIFLWLRSKQSS